MNIDIPYYEDKTRYSNSDIGYFLKYGPRSLKDYKEGGGNRLEGSFLDKGTMIHEYILQPDEFWKDYVILDFEVPKVKQQKDFCEAYASSLELLEDEKKLKAYKSSYNNSKSWQIALKEATELCDKYSQYIEYCKVKDTKKVRIYYGAYYQDNTPDKSGVYDKGYFKIVYKKFKYDLYLQSITFKKAA